MGTESIVREKTKDAAVSYTHLDVYKRQLSRRAGIPLIAAYEALADRYPRGLAELAPLREELSGEVQEVATQ